MSDQEFVILLGDEPQAPPADVAAQAADSAAPSADDGFVILLGDDAPTDAGEEASDEPDNPPASTAASDEFVVLLDAASPPVESLRIDGCRARLGSELGIAQVAEVYQQLAEWMSESDGELRLSLAECDYLDSAGWQLLGLFQRKLQQLGRGLQFEGVSESLHRDYQRYGVDGILPGLAAA